MQLVLLDYLQLGGIVLFSFIAAILTCYSYIRNSKVFKYLFSPKFAVMELTAEKDVTLSRRSGPVQVAVRAVYSKMLSAVCKSGCRYIIHNEPGAGVHLPDSR